MANKAKPTVWPRTSAGLARSCCASLCAAHGLYPALKLQSPPDQPNSLLPSLPSPMSPSPAPQLSPPESDHRQDHTIPASASHNTPQPSPSVELVASDSTAPGPAAVSTSASSSSTSSSAQLATLLSNALRDAELLRAQLAAESRRANKAERLLSAIQTASVSQDTQQSQGSPNTKNPNSTNPTPSSQQLPDSAVKALMEYEARAERAEERVQIDDGCRAPAPSSST